MIIENYQPVNAQHCTSIDPCTEPNTRIGNPNRDNVSAARGTTLFQCQFARRTRTAPKSTSAKANCTSSREMTVQPIVRVTTVGTNIATCENSSGEGQKLYPNFLNASAFTTCTVIPATYVIVEQLLALHLGYRRSPDLSN